MTWFADLTEYRYLDGQDPKKPALNIGWLERGHPFPSGDVPKPFIERLDVLCSHGLTMATRGRHDCDLCVVRDEEEPVWGSAEVRAVGSDGTRFAAPTLILHYVTVHRYRPPDAFIAAVLRVNLDWSYAEANDICISCGSGISRTRTRDGLVRGPNREPVVVVYFACEGCGTAYSRHFPVPSKT